MSGSQKMTRRTTQQPEERNNMTDYENYFGGCPQCGGNDGFANVGRSHWGFCTKHKTRWCFGSNLLSSWRDETQDQQRTWYNANNLGSFEKVEPLEMVDSKFKPIAGDRSSYPTHHDWFAVVLSRQKAMTLNSPKSRLAIYRNNIFRTFKSPVSVGQSFGWVIYGQKTHSED